MNQAHGMRLEHPIFKGPLAVDITLEEVDTPDNYAEWPEGRDGPEKTAVWTVQVPKFPEVDAGIVSDPYGFEDSPDSEWISSGINSKGPRAMALGRQGNLFLWGFTGEPAQLTESGRRVLVNAIAYMKGFDGAPVLVAADARGRLGQAREWAQVYVGYARAYAGDEKQEEWIQDLFSSGVKKSTEMDPDRLDAYFRDNLEFLHPGEGQKFECDEDCRTLGEGNRSPRFVPALIARWKAAPADALSARLAQRYVPAAAATDAAALEAWYRASEGRLFFSDRAGFRWLAAPAPTATGAVQPARN